MKDFKPRIVDRSKTPKLPSSDAYSLPSGVTEDDVDAMALAIARRMRQMHRIIENTPTGDAIYIPPSDEPMADHIVLSALKGSIETYTNLLVDGRQSEERNVQLLRMVLGAMVATQQRE